MIVILGVGAVIALVLAAPLAARLFLRSVDDPVGTADSCLRVVVALRLRHSHSAAVAVGIRVPVEPRRRVGDRRARAPHRRDPTRALRTLSRARSSS